MYTLFLVFMINVYIFINIKLKKAMKNMKKQKGIIYRYVDITFGSTLFKSLIFN